MTTSMRDLLLYPQITQIETSARGDVPSVVGGLGPLASAEAKRLKTGGIDPLSIIAERIGVGTL